MFLPRWCGAGALPIAHGLRAEAAEADEGRAKLSRVIVGKQTPEPETQEAHQARGDPADRLWRRQRSATLLVGWA